MKKLFVSMVAVAFATGTSSVSFADSHNKAEMTIKPTEKVVTQPIKESQIKPKVKKSADLTGQDSISKSADAPKAKSADPMMQK